MNIFAIVSNDIGSNSFASQKFQTLFSAGFSDLKLISLKLSFNDANIPFISDAFVPMLANSMELELELELELERHLNT